MFQTKKSTNQYSPIKVHPSWCNSYKNNFYFDSESLQPIVSSKIQQEESPFKNMNTMSESLLNCSDDKELKPLFNAQDELEISKMLDTYNLDLLQLDDLDKI